MENQNIVFFDGYCILCNGFVDFLIRQDKGNKLKFASLQGSTAKDELPSDFLSEFDSVVFKNKEGTVYFKSQAVLHILNSLNGVWKIYKIFLIIPTFISDLIYDFIANNRFSWFGKKDMCRLPTKDEKEKILP